jgi:hypothetical protein
MAAKMHWKGFSSNKIKIKFHFSSWKYTPYRTPLSDFIKRLVMMEKIGWMEGEITQRKV